MTDDLAVERGGGVEDLLDAGDVARERRHDDPPVERLHDLAERLADGPLRRRVAGVLGPGRVRQEADDALGAELREDREVGQLAVDRGVVELEVAGVDDDADRRPEGDAHRVGDRVADPERDDAERPDLELVARLEREHRVVVELVLLDLVAEQAAGERRGVDRHARELRQDVRQGADVVLVGVGDQERLDVGLALLEVGDVGDDEVDPEHLLVGEHQPAVDDDDVVAVLEHVHVLADLADAAERDDSKGKIGSAGHVFRAQKSVTSVVTSGIWAGIASGVDVGERWQRRRRPRPPVPPPCSRRDRASTQGGRDQARRRRSSGARPPSSGARPPGGTARTPSAFGAPVAGSTGRTVPWTWEMRAPGMNRPSECRPSVTTRAGSRTSSWRWRYGAQAAISSGSGSRLSGGRHFTTFVMKTSSRRQPSVPRNFVEQVAGATDERPARADPR